MNKCCKGKLRWKVSEVNECGEVDDFARKGPLVLIYPGKDYSGGHFKAPFPLRFLLNFEF
jgi:hypothetical protein